LGTQDTGRRQKRNNKQTNKTRSWKWKVVFVL